MLGRFTFGTNTTCRVEGLVDCHATTTLAHAGMFSDLKRGGKRVHARASLVDVILTRAARMRASDIERKADWEKRLNSRPNSGPNIHERTQIYNTFKGDRSIAT